MTDVESVGGKNASLGEMIGRLSGAGVSGTGRLRDDGPGLPRLPCAGPARGTHRRRARRPSMSATLHGSPRPARAFAAGSSIRRFQPTLEREVLAAASRLGNGGSAVAVRSSATAEDLPDASFAGQQETILNVRGSESVLAAMHQVYASLYNDRAISYRAHQGFDDTHWSRFRSACSTWCAATSARAASCSRSIPSRDSATLSSSPRPGDSASWSCRAP